ncbi:DNA adenine methylase [Kordiimonas sp.]|uniref:DNA adenine methylase n=1 Tax=Kordiimonas sp. TaxID=1970157 RepID=UPI003A8FF26D
MKTILKYHGGKSYLAPEYAPIIRRALFRAGDSPRYIERFAGGLSMLFHLPGEGVAEFAGDANGDLANFWRILADDTAFRIFERKVNCVPFGDAAFEAALKSIGDADRSPVQRAVDFFVIARQSRQGLCKSFATPTCRLRRGINENVSAWLAAVERLPEVHDRLRTVEVRQGHFRELMKLDSPSAVFFDDPTYVKSTRTAKEAYGEFEMSLKDHEELLHGYVGMQGTFFLCGYDNELYRRYESDHGWYRREFPRPNSSSSKRDDEGRKEIKVEVLWSNRRFD